MKGWPVSDPTGSPAELERQIEQARLDLARSVDAIVDRVHPKKVAQRSVARLKERMGLGQPSPDGTVVGSISVEGELIVWKTAAGRAPTAAAVTHTAVIWPSPGGMSMRISGSAP